MRSFLEIAFVLAAGLLIGGFLSAASLENNNQLAALTVGQWTAWPKAGSRDADPYTKARIAAEGEVPLGAAEGIAFFGRLDNEQAPLLKECNYRVSGLTPAARFWTLTAQTPEGELVHTAEKTPSSMISRSLVRQPNGEFTLHVGPTLASGNWMSTSGKGPYELILRIYDGQLSANLSLTEPQMPTIRLTGCE